MKYPIMERERVVNVLAAAVLTALGSTAVAQQPGSEQELPGAQQQQEQEQRTQSQQSQDRQQQGQESELQTAAAGQESGSGSQVLDQIAQEHDDLSTFIEAVKAAGMEDSLTGSTEYTVFAPTNDAWEQMSGMSTDELMQPENREQLISLLRAHIVADDVDEEMARNLQQAQTIDGGSVDLSASEDSIQVGNAQVVDSGIQEGNLRVYAIDGVLEPTALARAEGAQQDQSELQSEPDTDFGSERDTGLGSESESGLGSERDTGLGSERESELGSERDSPFGAESDQQDRTDPSGSQQEADRSPFGN